MTSEGSKIAISLMGPTAAGKTALALALAERLPVEVVSVDASQVYRGLDIGTAKPTAEERARVPHRLIDIRDPAETYSAAEFRAEALREMDDIVRRGRIPLLVGGTMFYFRALEFGLSPLPPADSAVRAQLAREAETGGLAALHARLARHDPEAATRIHPNDPQRLLRALEVLELAGRGPSEINRESPPAPAPFRFIKLAILPTDRDVLHACIEARFRAMLERGFLDEVERLKERGDLGPHLPAIRTVGYRQAWEYLSENMGYNAMVAAAGAATRQLAKRQLTWLRSYPDVAPLEMREPPDLDGCLERLRQERVGRTDLGL
jgi:tRNA dimethylallyltransferase